jgi:hypothetical protein
MDDVLKKIDKLRREKNLSVFKLTALSDLSENTIYNWYRKGSSPTLYALRSVCNVLNVSMSGVFAENTQEHLSAQEETLLLSFEELDDYQKELCLNLVKELAKKGKIS